MRIGSTFGSLPPVTKNLLIINTLIWLTIQFMPASTVARFENICALHYFTSTEFNPAQLITYMFMHVDFFHLFFNMFALFMFGMVIERTFGSKRFLFYYLSCGIGAALIQLGVFAIMINQYAASLPDGVTVSQISQIEVKPGYVLATGIDSIDMIWSLINTPVIGASGAIFGILLAFGFIYPKAPLYLFFIPVPIQARWFVIGYAVIELLQGVGNRVGDNVAHFAHLGGMIFGLIILLYWKKKGLFNNNYY